ncbi:MAG: 2-oxoglutarate/malate transporter, partial [Chlamydiia bacterium]|nr:2-oxoglutarate/malate transporter [Chlamydiia bacterium]
PMGALSLLAVSCLTLTKAVPLHTILQGFSNDLIWLIVMACFLARSFIKTGLGNRIAYAFVSFFGGTPLGLGYGLILSSAAMSPLIPSTTARTGGIILPVLKSLIQVIGDSAASKKVAAYLTMVVFHGSVLTSAMFVTSNAGNPIVVKFAKSAGIDITWSTWALAALLPGLLSLILLPLLLKFLIPCTVEDSAKVTQHAKDELASLGPVTVKEKITLSIFGVLLILWAFGGQLHVHPTEAAIFGVALLLLVNVLNWKDILSEEIAWDTFFWMAILIMMASELQNVGVVNYFTSQIVRIIPTYSWHFALAALSLIYFYSHYFFASTTAHLSSMFAPFLAVACTAGAPPLLAALCFGFIGNLFGGLTHYASGPAPILFSQGFVELKTWWKVGFALSIFYIIVWLGIGPLWWKFLNFY